ncbi:DNA internalization-related competence protein ComEC/Rec2 [Azoarcus sp. L1K30]|uniref:DNA internalization-related competence protein ComEC/Rec2 n=1 Tax=Azoarcus sp. L1K30 TaxID=2820277 RepID=UPI001B832054|nr:DNA internalization-related competence protein ComEC/Rec2 [Azoarcus sp. L1K30]MBR0565163.1 DNA internalization-related competence protein ComEC/Rec2 [Azoarcus sp. L1K30]
MPIAIFAFVAGVCLLQGQARLPAFGLVGEAATLLALTAMAGLCWYGRKRAMTGRRRVLCDAALGLALIGCGFLYAAVRAEVRLEDALQGSLEGQTLEVTGVIADLPREGDDGLRFVFDVERADEGVPSRILLSWYRVREEGAALPTVSAGQRWHLAVRLKRPHGSSTPGVFDYEAWLLEHGIRATGYVRSGRVATGAAAQATGFMYGLHRLRGQLRARILEALPGAPHAGVLVALAVGDQGAIDPADWEVFRRTGVSHLVAISGMHISLVGLLAGGLCAMLWRRLPWLTLRLPARKAATIAALVAAAGYAMLAGLGIPVQRALIMMTVGAIALLTGRESSAVRVLMLALASVTVLDPWAVLSPGFWLSFGAVAIILLVMGGHVAPIAPWRAAVKIQLAVTLASMPLLVGLFNAFSLVSPVANALAIPLVNFVITPLALAGIVWPHAWVLVPADAATTWMMVALEWLSSAEMALRQQSSPPPWLTLGGALAATWMLLPRGTPGRLGAIAPVLALLAWQAGRPAEGSFRATVLDVGQGLAVHVQTAAHDLLYDAGPPYGRTDAGERVVLPFLTAAGVNRLDRMILSHDDADHVGGAESILTALPVERILAGEREAVLRGLGAWPSAVCVAGTKWTWDGVLFEVLWPDPTMLPPRRNNDLSCVIRVSADGGSMLLLGDIEETAETALLARHGDALASSVAVVAHHGSRSSSTMDFVDAVMPAAAIFSVGYRSRFGHPHPAVWARWSAAGARNYRTDAQGSIIVNADRDGVDIDAWRAREARYWHGR